MYALSLSASLYWAAAVLRPWVVVRQLRKDQPGRNRMWIRADSQLVAYGHNAADAILCAVLRMSAIPSQRPASADEGFHLITNADYHASAS